METIELQYLADLAAADCIISVKRMRQARKRIELWLSQRKHMCLERGCDQPVVGSKIFRHCSLHLAETEKRWLDEEVEQRGFEVLADGLEPCGLAKVAHNIDVRWAQKNVEEKSAALNEAFKVSEAFQETLRLRDEMLPRRLLARLTGYEKSLLEEDTE